MSLNPIPNLIHPVVVTLRQINKAGTIQDADALEPVRQAKRNAAVTCLAQVKIEASKVLRFEDGGPVEGATGTATFRQVDLTAAGITLALGDRISQIGTRAMDVYVIKIEPMGHYPAHGATMMKVHFHDREPSKAGV